MFRNLIKSVTLAIIFLAIILSAYRAGIEPVAMRRESKPVVGEIVEGRSVIVNLASGRVWILEV